MNRLTKDPLGVAGGINLHGFVHNDPVNFVDPNGMKGISLDFGGDLSTGLGHIGGQAGSGIYIGAKKGGHADYFLSIGPGFGVTADECGTAAATQHALQ